MKVEIDELKRRRSVASTGVSRDARFTPGAANARLARPHKVTMKDLILSFGADRNE